MHTLGMWRLFCLLGTLGSSFCVNEVEFEGNYADNYDNEITEDQQEGDSQTTPCQADFSRWDKLFINLEDSHMRQSMLLESVQQCCGGMGSLKALVDKLPKGNCHHCAASLESACRVHSEQASLQLHLGLAELKEDQTERERRLNATLQMLLRSNQEESARLKRLEQSLEASRPADGRMDHQPTPRPGGLGAFGLEWKPHTSGLKEQEVTSPLDTMETSLVAIATELQRLHLRLNQVIEQAGAMKKDRGDT